MNFKDKIVLITGGASGIGATTARLFAEYDATVIAADLNIDAARSVAEEIRKKGKTATALAVDVADFGQVKKLMQDVVEQFGRIDVLVNGAGIINKQMTRTADHSLEEWDKIIAINQNGVFYCMKTALPYMLKQEGGSIVNIASLAGLKASGNNIAYSASKFAVVGMTKSAALEYASKNIRVNAVCPSYTHSPMLHNSLEVMPPDFDKTLLRMIPMRRFGEAHEVAQSILWLASEHSSYITGQAITLDGGLSL